MAIKSGHRLPAEFDAVFPRGLVAVGEVAPVIRYNQDRNAPKVQRLDINETTGELYTGLRMWKVAVLDPDQDNAKRKAFEVILLSEHQPVFPTSAREDDNGMRRIRLEGLTVEPFVVRQGSGERNFSYVDYRFYSTGFEGDTNTPKTNARNGSDVKAGA